MIYPGLPNIKWRGKPLDELTRDELLQALDTALRQLHQLSPPDEIEALGKALNHRHHPPLSV